jgi:hypothetical protein
MFYDMDNMYFTDKLHLRGSPLVFVQIYSQLLNYIIKVF